MAKFGSVGFIFVFNILFIDASHHWIVTENGRAEVKLDSGFPLRRSYDLVTVLEQEQRMALIAELDERLHRMKASLDQQWVSIEEETDFEKRLYATDKNCLLAGLPLSQFDLVPHFFDKIHPNRPLLPAERMNELPPDCTKFHRLDFSMLTFPHLKSVSEAKNISRGIESDAPMEFDLAAMLKANRSDWTAYNLAAHYWQLRAKNSSNAIQCARRAIYFAPREFRFLPLLNLGNLLQSCRSVGEAAIVLHAAVDLDRSQYRSHIALGHVYALLGDYDRSAGCYANALALRPDMTDLGKHRAAVLCHKKLVTGLKALDAALKKIVDELHTYGQLHQTRLKTQTMIADARAFGTPFQPLSAGVSSLWDAIDQQVYMLTERMNRVDPLTRRERVQKEWLEGESRQCQLESQSMDPTM